MGEIFPVCLTTVYPSVWVVCAASKLVAWKPYSDDNTVGRLRDNWRRKLNPKNADGTASILSSISQKKTDQR